MKDMKKDPKFKTQCECYVITNSKDFFLLFLLAAEKSLLLNWTDNFTILLTLLTIALAVWTGPWIWIWTDK